MILAISFALGWAACVGFQLLWTAVCDFAGSKMREEYGAPCPWPLKDGAATRIGGGATLGTQNTVPSVSSDGSEASK